MESVLFSESQFRDSILGGWKEDVADEASSQNLESAYYVLVTLLNI